MSVKSEVFEWLGNHPEEATKKGYGSNIELRNAFPDQTSKLLSKYKVQFNIIKRKEYIHPKPKPKSEIKTIPPKESLTRSMDLIDILKKQMKKKKSFFLFCGLGLLLLIIIYLKLKCLKKSKK